MTPHQKADLQSDTSTDETKHTDEQSVPMMRRLHNDEGGAPSRSCRPPPERVLLLLVLLALLAVAVFVICKLSFPTISETVQSLREENEALRRNLSEPACVKCGADWELHGGSCYKFNRVRSSWTGSRRSCRAQGGDLVKIDSTEEQTFLEARLGDLMEDNEDKFWIGLTDSEEEDRWVWVDGSPLDERLSFWFPGQPDDLGLYDQPEADCVRMGERHGADDLKCWYDRGCHHPQKSVCEKAAGSGKGSAGVSKSQLRM